MGRKGKLKTSMTVQESVDGVKKHLNLSHVRLASTPGNFTFKRSDFVLLLTTHSFED